MGLFLFLSYFWSQSFTESLGELKSQSNYIGVIILIV